MTGPTLSPGGLRLSAELVRYYATTPADPQAETLTPRRPYLDRDREAVLLGVAGELEELAAMLDRRPWWRRVGRWIARLGRARALTWA